MNRPHPVSAPLPGTALRTPIRQPSALRAALALLLLLGLLALPACGGDTGASGPPATDTSSDGDSDTSDEVTDTGDDATGDGEGTSAGDGDLPPTSTGLPPSTAPADGDGDGTASDDGDGAASDDGDTGETSEPPTTQTDPVDERCPQGRIREVFNEDLVPGGWNAFHFHRCAPTGHRLVVPAGARWRIDGEELPADARLFLHGTHWRSPLDGVSPSPLASSSFAGAGGTADLTFSAEISGEHTLLIERDDADHSDRYTLRVTCLEGCTLKSTRYPLVFLHGYAGIDSYFGVVDYFWGVRALLGDAGFSVHTPVSTPIATSQRRAGELEPQLEAILETTGAPRLNIIAHSQGGLDARVLVSAMGWHDRVASITTVATPHRGIGLRLADFLSVQDFSVAYMEEEFNPEHPDHPDVAYYSWSARACRLSQSTCRHQTGGALVDTLLVASHLALSSEFGDNDGIVPTSSMPWGDHLGELFADHFGEVGHLFKRDDPGAPFNHRGFYFSEAERLKEAGF